MLTIRNLAECGQNLARRKRVFYSTHFAGFPRQSGSPYRCRPSVQTAYSTIRSVRTAESAKFLPICVDYSTLPVPSGGGRETIFRTTDELKSSVRRHHLCSYLRWYLPLLGASAWVFHRGGPTLSLRASMQRGRAFEPRRDPASVDVGMKELVATGLLVKGPAIKGYVVNGNSNSTQTGSEDTNTWIDRMNITDPENARLFESSIISSTLPEHAVQGIVERSERGFELYMPSAHLRDAYCFSSCSDIKIPFPS
ncbi:hypothetical protein BC826DRAFT_969773 [Russula brevipes]|nr:hypothetical protein BC826DRAFT_969773 [Russula brevipes]